VFTQPIALELLWVRLDPAGPPVENPATQIFYKPLAYPVTQLTQQCSEGDR